jgi:hypothetical protein
MRRVFVAQAAPCAHRLSSRATGRYTGPPEKPGCGRTMSIVGGQDDPRIGVRDERSRSRSPLGFGVRDGGVGAVGGGLELPVLIASGGGTGCAAPVVLAKKHAKATKAGQKAAARVVKTNTATAPVDRFGSFVRPCFSPSQGPSHMRWTFATCLTNRMWWGGCSPTAKLDWDNLGFGLTETTYMYKMTKPRGGGEV